MFKIILILFLLIFTSGLQTEAQNSQLRPAIGKIVNKLREENMLHLGARVGYAAIPETNNEYYKLYSKLKAKATTEELIQLTKDSSKIILLYAFNILHARSYPGLKELYLEHANDSTIVWQASGCTGLAWEVNSYMLHLLNPQVNNP